MIVQIRNGYYPIIHSAVELENITFDDFTDHAADLMLFPDTGSDRYEGWINDHRVQCSREDYKPTECYIKTATSMPLAIPGSIYLQDTINNLRHFGNNKFVLVRLVDPVMMRLDVLISPRNVGYGYIDYMGRDDVVSWLVGIPHPTKAGNIMISDSIVRKCAAWVYYD